ncbi:MAG: hypothetical protein ACP5UR_12905, partial [Chloroflexus sp.]
MQLSDNISVTKRHTYLFQTIGLAIGLALLPVLCVIQTIFWLLTPVDKPFTLARAERADDADMFVVRSSLIANIYEPFLTNLSFAQVAADFPNLAATEIANRTYNFTVDQVSRGTPVSIVVIPPQSTVTPTVPQPSPTATVVSSPTKPSASPTPTTATSRATPIPFPTFTPTPALIDVPTPMSPEKLSTKPTMANVPLVTPLAQPTATVELAVTPMTAPTATPTATVEPTVTPMT